MGAYNWREVLDLKNALKDANARLQERDHQDVLALVAAREGDADAREAAQRAADQRARDDEIEAVRKSAWFMHLTSPEQIEKNGWPDSMSATWRENNTPKEGWPPGDGPENYHYSSVAPPVEPLDDGVVPPLVLRARQMGLDI